MASFVDSLKEVVGNCLQVDHIVDGEKRVVAFLEADASSIPSCSMKEWPLSQLGGVKAKKEAPNSKLELAYYTSSFSVRRSRRPQTRLLERIRCSRLKFANSWQSYEGLLIRHDEQNKLCLGGVGAYKLYVPKD